MESAFMGIDIGKTNFRVAVAGVSPQLRCYDKITYKRGLPAEMDQQIGEAIQAGLRSASVRNGSLAGIGIGVPAIVNRGDGRIVFGADFDFLRGHSFARRVEQCYGVPVVTDVDTVMASWGEQWAGMGCSCERFALITWGTSLGAGLILDGKVYEGPNNLFAEFGHCIVSDDDWPCICGSRGCVAQLVSGSGIAEHGRRAVLDGRKTKLRDLCGNNSGAVTASLVFEAASLRDGVALQILERVGVLLGRLCANLVYTIQPEKIVIVGGLAEQAKWILETMNRTMREHCWLMLKGFTQCEVVVSSLGDTAGVLGAIRMAQLNTNTPLKNILTK